MKLFIEHGLQWTGNVGMNVGTLSYIVHKMMLILQHHYQKEIQEVSEDISHEALRA